MSGENRPISAASLIYVTCGSVNEARQIGDTVVRERLAACANIIDGMQSIYWWEGAVQEGAETILILKTAVANVTALSERVKALHSYDVPCVAEIPLGGGNADYFDWIVAESNVNPR
ncbi:MAG: divalent-cation tolerance protein CutA [Rhodospirillaceae bacterium]|jgi:periplasmic divalent cation tolerance protein|nr:divalent-cation tolerance protein CutA [Rhodospirillaceae bacterium]MBT3929609.1 divalent-cation tolerance protein CutA [Rhodospirillaceae bacterium]MBT4905855.1 divalent-cation tolerance protein CutA [Rhodospirillaceae bacterium]MBT5357162.1 divalent-cation tolerance protein CutA [Rhodospirillaceae bacterium]MBT5770382.1 divalent-cation tolerance protein CutA [Rhodospirillaceae bacterium]